MPLTTGYANSSQMKRVYRGPDALPQTAQGTLFNISGRVLALSIEGEVTTVVQTQLNNTKLVANPTVGADTDICAVLDITAAAVGSIFHITGTFANALIKSTNGAHIEQAGGVVLTAGTLDLSCSASNTGALTHWVIWEPMTGGGNVT